MRKAMTEPLRPLFETGRSKFEEKRATESNVELLPNYDVLLLQHPLR